MKNIITTNKIFGMMTLAFAMVFLVGFAHVSTAQAYYHGNDGYYTNHGSYGYDHDYGYDNSSNDLAYYYQPVYTAPTYVYPVTYPVISPLEVSCYPEPSSTYVGNSVLWASSVSGGTGSYSYSWSGSNGFLGNSSTVSTVYYSPGTYNAYLTVTSGGQTQSVSCSSGVVVNASSYYVSSPTYVYTTPTYVSTPSSYPYATYSPLQASCVANVSSSAVGSSVVWTATASGGTGIYDYSWSGTDGISGYSQSISVNYSIPGQKTAAVTVYSNGQSITENCYPSITISGYQASSNTGASNNNSGLDIGCYADPTTASIDQPITWSVEVTGGTAPYTYSWSGSDGLTGTGSSIIKYYDSYGEKSAIVSVTSSDGKTGTRACSNAVNVRGAGGGSSVAPAGNTGSAATAPAATNANQTNNSQSAAALFSLQNVPWGWIAILIILVLFATILYLVFNRPKI
jgi:SprB repeat